MTDFISFSGLNLLDSSDILNELLKTQTNQETRDKEKYQTKIGWVYTLTHVIAMAMMLENEKSAFGELESLSTPCGEVVEHCCVLSSLDL